MAAGESDKVELVFVDLGTAEQLLHVLHSGLGLLLAGQARNLNGYPPTAILAFDGLHREGRDWSLSREFAHHLANLSN